MNEYNIKPIGYVKNSISQRKEMVALGVESQVIVDEKFLPALKFVDQNSHIILFCLFHKANREVLEVRPTKFGIMRDLLKGVFSTRSPDRPNPISCTVAKLLKLEGNVLMVDRLDAIDGTPIIDIKGYSAGTDAVFNTNSVNIKTDFSISSDERLEEYLINGLRQYLFEYDSSFNIGIYTLMKVIRELNEMPDRFNLAHIETNFSGNALDCLYYYCRFTPGENKIRVIEGNKNTICKFILDSGKTILIENTEKKLNEFKKLKLSWVN